MFGLIETVKNLTENSILIEFATRKDAEIVSIYDTSLIEFLLINVCFYK